LRRMNRSTTDYFNSATAVKPWRHPCASKRHRSLASLQFGHGGEAVETWSRTSVEGTRSGKLQFGHGGEAVETRGAGRRGTGSVRYFNSATAVKPWRPVTVKPIRRSIAKLQFGHGGEAVETPCPCCGTAAIVILQFGHGGEAVETPWPKAVVALSVEILQFGHGGEAVETPRPRRANRNATSYFNSATAVKPWRHLYRAGRCSGLTDFNSATAVKPWRRSLRNQQRPADWRTSIRPRR